MNKFIKEQLLKCKVAKIPYFDDNTTELFIPKGNFSAHPTANVVADDDPFQIGKCFDVIIDKSLVENCEWYHTIHDRWNGGVGPDDTNIRIEITNRNGKMVGVRAVGLNTGHAWQGFIPKGNIRSVTEVNNGIIS